MSGLCRWDRGRFGKEWEECQDHQARQNWDQKLGLGRNKIFEVRRIYNDVVFIDTFLTPEFARHHKFFTYKFNRRTKEYVIDSRDFEKIKRQLLFSLTNFGQPIIVVQNANHGNQGALLLHHQHEGLDLKMDWALDTLENIYAVWSRPVHIETMVEDKPMLFSFDGDEHAQKKLE